MFFSDLEKAILSQTIGQKSRVKLVKFSSNRCTWIRYAAAVYLLLFVSAYLFLGIPESIESKEIASVLAIDGLAIFLTIS